MSFYTGDAETGRVHRAAARLLRLHLGRCPVRRASIPTGIPRKTVDNQIGADRDQKTKRDLWNVTLGETQYQWFKQTLETSRAKYKFVFAHHVNGAGAAASNWPTLLRVG